VISAALTARQPLVFCPAHNGEQSPKPWASKCARSGATAAVAVGKAGAAGCRGPKVRMSRLTMPRAGRPENTVVKSVWAESGLSKAARCTALVLASWQHK
jgi:hypothetical protein